MISYRYLIGDGENPVSPGTPLWESPLPMDRHHFQSSENATSSHPVVSHGDYFTWARLFLEREGLAMAALPASFSLEEIHRVDICLMKHGACYHPARIAVSGDGLKALYVLNVAVSDSGLGIMDSEIRALNRLGEGAGPHPVPRVYGQGRASARGREVRMFLGEWFREFYEFHLSSRDRAGLRVWGGGDEAFRLSPEEAFLVYHQAAKILTRYYDPETTAHISSWRHAAGDFVVRRREGGVDVRLITVRSYAPLLRIPEGDPGPAERVERAMGALLLFLLGLSVRMRLDRLDGIGAVGWADETALMATWTGFLEGLSEGFFPASFLPDPRAQFQEHLATYSPEDVYALGGRVAASIGLVPEEKAVVETYLAAHMAALCETIGRIGF